jgi:hypothetical protein
VTDRPLQDTQNLTRNSECHISNSYLDTSNQPSTSVLKTGPSASQSNLHHVIPVEIRHFPKAEARKETRKRKPRVTAVLTDTPVKAALEAEVEAHSKPIKRNRLFSYSQEKTRKSKQLKRMFEELSHLTRKMTMNASVSNVQKRTPCPEHLQNGSSALSATNGPTTVAPNLATSMFVGSATLMTTLMTSCLKIDVK